MPTAKSLTDHVRDGTFRSRRHHPLLAGPAVPWPELATLQGRYAAAAQELERRAVGVEFERAVRDLEKRVGTDPAIEDLERLLSLPPVPMAIALDRRLVERYWRAMEIAELVDEGVPQAEVAAKFGVSPTTVRRELGWLEKEFGGLLSPPRRAAWM
jgi:hypothetical protein